MISLEIAKLGGGGAFCPSPPIFKLGKIPVQTGLITGLIWPKYLLFYRD